jgi:DNA repair exonuclease SbcCD nuclease subunit
MIDIVVQQQPDLFTIAGDCFHHARPSMHAIVAFRDGIRRVVEETQSHVVIIQGNHDGARTAEVLTPIAIANGYERVHVVTTPKRIRLNVHKEKISVACFPYVARGNGEVYRLDPDPTADVNLLLLHAAVRGNAEAGGLPWFYAGENALNIEREADKWDVVHAGDFHEFTRLHPTALAFYAGAIERTSSDIWRESAPKGVVEYDTASHEIRFVEIPTRPMYNLDVSDLPDFCSIGDTIGAAVLNEILAEIAKTDEYDDAIVRLKATDFPAEERGDIDQALVREIKKRCLHFELDVRNAKREISAMGDRRDLETGLSLAAALDAFTADEDPEVRALVASFLGVELPEPVQELAEVAV